LRKGNSFLSRRENQILRPRFQKTGSANFRLVFSI